MKNIKRLRIPDGSGVFTPKDIASFCTALEDSQIITQSNVSGSTLNLTDGVNKVSKYEVLISKYNDLIESQKPVVQNTVCENCNNCSWCSDCSYCDNCEKCYHCTACNKCVDCDDCNYCHYCTDCESCECCLFCVGLRVQNNNPEMTLGELEETPYNKMLDINKYYVLNEQVSKEEFEQTLKIVMENNGKQ